MNGLSNHNQIIHQNTNFMVHYPQKVNLKKLSRWLVCLAVCLATGFSSIAQNATVSGSTAADGTYATLSDAFIAINANAQTGNNVIINIDGNTTETISAVLNDGGWTSLTIRPNGGAARTISGAIATNLIDLNGCDNVTIDGLNTGGNSLTISNTSTATSSATIRFIADASNNTITKCTLLGSTGAALTSGFGVLFFSTGTTTGNDNNTISNNVINAAGTNLPICGIFSLGTSTAIDNSGNNVINNSISNYYNTSAASHGMNINTGNSGWTISGNSFFQSASRNYTTASTHTGINITSGSGYTISGNFVGGNTINAGGTAYAMTGTIATRFIGINVAAGTTTALNTIQNNTISNITLNTSSGASTTNGVICGINLTAGSANINGNTVGSTSGINSIVAVPTTAGGVVVGVHSSSTGAVTIQNNFIGSLSSSGVTAAVSGGILAINVSGIASSLAINNNTIGNATANNLRGGTLGLTTGSSAVAGITLSNSPAGTISISGNIIQNLTSFGSGTTGYVRGIQTFAVGGAASVYNINNNTIYNLTTNANNTSLANGNTCATGIVLSGGNASTISLNTVYNLSNISTGTTASYVAGIMHGNATNTIITRNKIYGLSNAGTSVTTTAPSAIVGIGVRSGTTALTIQNNMISLGDGITTNSAIIGIMLNHGSTPDPIDNIYYNSIFINGTAASGAQPSIGISRGDFSVTARVVTVNIKNNIVSNQRSGGTGKHYAIANNLGATTSATGWAANASNNNVFNTANPATLGYWTTDQNFATWQTASLCDGLSKTGLSLPFVNTPTADLHLTFGLTPTQIESGGVTVSGVTNDYDNDTRPGPTGSLNGGGLAPDMGADEFDAVPLDVNAPAISNIALLGNACGTTGRTVTATLIDASGVDNAGSEPQIYFRKNGGAYFSEPGVLTAGTVNNGTWTFNINYVSLGGVVYTDLIEYFIVAQDVLTNVGGTPSSGLSLTDVFTITTPPTTPLSFTIQTFISGNYPVGVGQSGLGGYETLTAAIAAFNSSCLGGPVTYTLMDASYSAGETFPIIINKNPDASAINTLTIKPNTGVNAAITGSFAGYLIRNLNSYVTIDGSNNGSNSRNLTISNTSATSPSVILIGSTGTTPIQHVAVKNSILLNGATTNTAVVISDATAPGTAGYFNNITIDNNDIQKAFIGCYSIAALVAGNGGNTAITNNTLTATGGNAIRRAGLYLQGIDGANVSGNSIGNFDASTAESDYAIWLATGTSNTTVSNNIISNLGMASTGAFAPYGIYVSSGVSPSNISVNGNNISGLSSAGGGAGVATNGIFFGFSTTHGTISNNQITNIKNSSTSGWGANGIQLASTSLSANILVSNNFVSDVAGYGFAGGAVDDNGYGISVNSGAGYSIYHNTVNLTTSQTVATGFPAAFLVGSGVTTAGAIDLRNNIFVNSQTAGTERYAIYSAAPNTVFSNINYNDYFSAGPNLGFIGLNRTLLADITSGFGGNANSVSVNPVFTSATDLHLVSSSNAGLSDLGTPLAAVTTDIDAQTRSASTPDMGADEFVGQSVLNLKLWLQGYYSGGAMVPVMENQASVIPHDPTLDVDDITVELHSAATPATVSYTTTARLKTNGTAVATFSTGISGNYHVVIKHRNTLQTWSNDPVSFPPAATLDFTTLVTTTLGSNVKEVPTTGTGVWALFTGDLNQDDFIDSFDFPDFDTDSFNGVSGVYVATDLNGDGFVDSFDFPILDENSFNGVTAITL